MTTITVRFVLIPSQRGKSFKAPNGGAVHTPSIRLNPLSTGQILQRLKITDDQGRTVAVLIPSQRGKSFKVGSLSGLCHSMPGLNPLSTGQILQRR